MGLRNSNLALLFQLLVLVMCGSAGIYGVKDLREKQRVAFHGTGDVKDLPQLVKEVDEDKYSSSIAAWRSSVDKSTDLSSQLAKELEDKYSSLSILLPSNNSIHKISTDQSSSSQLAKELEETYSSSLSDDKSTELNFDQLVKELEDKYSSLALLIADESSPQLSSQVAKKLEDQYLGLTGL